MANSRKLQLITLAIVGWYLLLIILHYFNQRPLWNDEYCIYFNIHDRSSADLFSGPLSQFQQFPRIYLYIIGQWSKMLDYHLLALRFFPFICMLGAFFIWMYLGKKQTSSSMGLLMFVLCWAASSKLVYYSAELKQYSMDVLTSATFILFLFHQKQIQEKGLGWKYAVLLLVLPWLGLFSYPVFFFLPLPAFNLLMEARNNSRLWPFLGGYLASCLAVFAVVYCVDIRISNVSWLGTATDWNEHMVSLSSPKLFFKTLGEGCDNLTSRWFVDHPKWVRMAARFFMALGFWRLLLGGWNAFKEDGFRLISIRSIAFVVFWEHLFLSMAHKYPFGVTRTSLFFAPMLLFVTVDAFEWIKRRNYFLCNLVQYPFLIYLVYISIGLAREIFAGDLGADPYIWR
jgi:hypothetical protein